MLTRAMPAASTPAQPPRKARVARRGAECCFMGFSFANSLDGHPAPGLQHRAVIQAQGEAGRGEEHQHAVRQGDDLQFDAVFGVLLLQALPGTQGIYGFLIAFLTLSQIGVIGGGAVEVSVTKGMLYFLACMPMAFVGLWSAIRQAKAAVSCIGLIAKRPDQLGKAIILPAMVETYAILALLVSILAIFGITPLAL